MISSNYEKTGGDLAAFFNDILEPLMQAILIAWIKTYKKPVLTTTFLGSAKSDVSIGYHAYPSTERAAKVAEKLAEYREILERGKDFKDGI